MPWLNPPFDLRCEPQLDGVKFKRNVMRADTIKAGANITIKGQASSSSTLRLFSSGKRILTDQEEVASSHNGPQTDLNVIRLTFEWGHSYGGRVTTSFALPKENGPIHEKVAKKGHVGSVGLGSTTSIDYQLRSCNFKPELGFKPLTFLFRYAPEDWLQAREIIPSEDSSSNAVKRERSTTPDVIDLDELEIDDDDIVVIKHLVPAGGLPSKKRQKVQDKRREVEDEDTKPKLEP
ncbi:hypothetical protein FRC07_000848 [Ceratobasidium sp. 392]|nr:hypothetical protein FRC07_000848 [Ceratobasidium sp. 392]